MATGFSTSSVAPVRVSLYTNCKFCKRVVLFRQRDFSPKRPSLIGYYEVTCFPPKVSKRAKKDQKIKVL